MKASESPVPEVVFEEGAFLKVAALLEAQGSRRPFVVTTAGRRKEFSSLETASSVRLEIFDGAVEHVPVEVTDRAEALLRRAEADSIVSLGGGSATGLGKALALRTSLPLIAVPTTYSGSEVTSIYGLTDRDGKKTGRDARVLPRLVIYDPLLTLGLPPGVSAASGMNALAHSVEALYASNASAESSAWAERSIRDLAAALPVLMDDPTDLTARSQAMRGSQLAGMALNATVMGLHHRICHVLGGSFGMPHAKTHAVILPYVVSFNSPHAEDAMSRIAGALGVSDAPSGIRALVRSLPLPRSLAELGFSKENIPGAAREIAEANYPNPAPVSAEDVERILTKAWKGE